MAILITLQGPEPGKKYQLTEPYSILGRQLDSTVCLVAKAVSRQHAKILCENGAFFVEDLESSNGTYVNNRRIPAGVRMPLTEQDTLQIGPYVLALRPEPTVAVTEPSLVIRDQINAISLDQSVYEQAPAQKLQVVLETAQHLARTLDPDQLLGKLLDQLMRLFPQADRAMFLGCDDEKLVVRAMRFRHLNDDTACAYSRTIVKQALEQGVGILSEDVQGDQRFQTSATLTSLDLHSLLCVPLITQDGKRLGILQVDRFRGGSPFRKEDLELLTTIALQVVTVLENASLHQEVLREQRLLQELELAREIQQGFLPGDFDDFNTDGIEIFAAVHPARMVSGDLYDVLRLPDGRISFFVGDVSGKGMPAALFMIAVRTLCRHVALRGGSPSKTLEQINESLITDNPHGMFVTLCHGLYAPDNGEMVLASGGHFFPLLRRVNGTIDEIPHRPGRPLGYEGLELEISDAAARLEPGDVAVFYTDGVTEARGPGTKTMFGLPGLRALVSELHPGLSLPGCVELVRNAVTRFTGSKELQDDLTMFLLRRHAMRP